MGELGWDRIPEDLEGAAREAHLTRRDLLRRAAASAGIAASIAGGLPASTVLAHATRRRRIALPSPRNMPIDHFVILMMENRSFDHYFGWLPGADGRQRGLTFTDNEGQEVHTHRLRSDFQGCAHPDPDHSWEGGRFQLDGGRLGGLSPRRHNP